MVPLKSVATKQFCSSWHSLRAELALVADVKCRILCVVQALEETSMDLGARGGGDDDSGASGASGPPGDARCHGQCLGAQSGAGSTSWAEPDLLPNRRVPNNARLAALRFCARQAENALVDAEENTAQQASPFLPSPSSSSPPSSSPPPSSAHQTPPPAANSCLRRPHSPCRCRQCSSPSPRLPCRPTTPSLCAPPGRSGQNRRRRRRRRFFFFFFFFSRAGPAAPRGRQEPAPLVGELAAGRSR